MPTGTVRPASIFNSANLQWADTVGNTPVAANISYIADNVDLSEMFRSAYGVTTNLFTVMQVLTMPTGSLTRTFTVRSRSRNFNYPTPGGACPNTMQLYAGGNTAGFLAGTSTITTNSDAWTNYTAAPITYSVGQAGLDLLFLRINIDTPDNQSTFSEVYLDILYALPPSATVTAPTGTITNRTPTISWLFTQGTDGTGLQSMYRVRIFNAAQYGAGGFNPSTTPGAIDDSGFIFPSSTTSYTVTTPLPNITTYKAYVLVYQHTGTQDQPATSYAAGPAFTVDTTVQATAAASYTFTATASALPQVLAVAAGAWGAMVGAVAAFPKTPVMATAAAAWGGMTGAATVSPGTLPSTAHWTDVYVEFLVRIDDPAASLVLEKLLIERNHLGGYFDGSTVTGGFLTGTPSISDYRWESAPNASRSLYANEYERTNGIVDALLFDAFPINEASKYTILSYNGVHGVTDVSTTRWGRSRWGEGVWS